MNRVMKWVIGMGRGGTIELVASNEPKQPLPIPKNDCNPTE